MKKFNIVMMLFIVRTVKHGERNNHKYIQYCLAYNDRLRGNNTLIYTLTWPNYHY